MDLGIWPVSLAGKPNRVANSHWQACRCGDRGIPARHFEHARCGVVFREGRLEQPQRIVDAPDGWFRAMGDKHHIHRDVWRHRRRCPWRRARCPENDEGREKASSQGLTHGLDGGALGLVRQDKQTPKAAKS